MGVAAGGNNNSCVFKYNPPDNYDPLETVDGPSGELDGKQLFFDFDELECTLSIRSCARGVFVTTV